MRKNILIGGIIVLVIGFAMFFGGPYIFKSTVNLNQLLPLKDSLSINPGTGVAFTVVPAGKVMAAVYNDSLSKPIEFKSINETVSTQNENGTFIIEYYNAGNSNQTIDLVNNYTVPMTVNYSVLIFSASGIIYSIILVLLGGALMFIGGIIAVIGLILKSKRSNPV